MSELPWDTIIQIIGLIVTILTIVASAWKLRGWIEDRFNKIDNRFNGIESRLKSIEDNPILLGIKQITAEMWSNILHDSLEKGIRGNPLTQVEINRRVELTKKLQDKTITHDEAKELNVILYKELEEARETGNFLAFLAILALLGLLLAILASD